jgi:hypothetical protein
MHRVSVEPKPSQLQKVARREETLGKESAWAWGASGLIAARSSWGMAVRARISRGMQRRRGRCRGMRGSFR